MKVWVSNLIELRDVIIKKGKTVILNQVNLQINDGNFYLLRAGNGLGKSSLLNAISGIETAHQGQIIFFKQNQRITRRQDIAQLVCYLPHDYTLDYQLTGKDYLRLYQQLWHSQVDITALCL